MAQNRLGGPGLGLPYPQALYPATLIGSAYFPAGNEITLGAGECLPVPPGDWFIQLGKYTQIQFLDPVTTTWRSLTPDPAENTVIHSDGQNIRVANLLGCPVAGIVTGLGTGYIAGSTTITPSGSGGSTWVAVVGGALNVTVSVTSAGSGYTLAPQVFIPAPPSPGVQATAIAVISSGTVSSVSIINQGAGYTTAPTIALMASPYDPNLGTIVNATATCVLTGAGAVTAALCTNSGAPQTTAPTLTVAGVGTTATLSCVLLQTVTGGTISGAGAAYGASTVLSTAGGIPTATPTFQNPATEAGVLSPPRQAQIGLTITGGTVTSIGTIYDGGLFTGTPTTLFLTNGVPTTPATISLALGSTYDTVILQPL